MWDAMAFLGLALFLAGVVTVVKPIAALKIPTRGRAGAILFAGFFLFVVGATNADMGPPPEAAVQRGDEPPPPPAVQQASAPEPPPATPEDRVRRAIREQYRNQVAITVEGGRVIVGFDVADNLTENMIKRGAKMDVKNILQGLHESGFGYEHVQVQGSLPLTDRFGNSEKSVVVNVGYDYSTVAQINWPNMLTENMYLVADSVAIHPAFRD